MKNDRHVLICTYRRLIHGSYRWYTTEIVPDADYSEQNQVVMLYERDVHDVYGKGLDLEKMSIQNDRRMAVIIKSRFDVMNTIDLDTGMCERIYLGVEDEGSRIRTGDYDYYIEKAVKEVICFDQALERAYKFYEQHPDETLIVVTADHETGGMSVGRRRPDITAIRNMWTARRCRRSFSPTGAGI